MLGQPPSRGPRSSGFARLNDRVTIHPEVIASLLVMSDDLGVSFAELCRAALTDVAIGAGYLAPEDRDRFVVANNKKGPHR